MAPDTPVKRKRSSSRCSSQKVGWGKFSVAVLAFLKTYIEMHLKNRRLGFFATVTGVLPDGCIHRCFSNLWPVCFATVSCPRVFFWRRFSFLRQLVMSSGGRT